MNKEQNVFGPMLDEIKIKYPVVFNLMKEIIKQNEDMQDLLLTLYDLLFTLYDKVEVLPDKLIKDFIRKRLEKLHGISLEEIRK